MPKLHTLSKTEKVLQAATAARFCALGYYVIVDMELPMGFHMVCDVAGIRPVLKEIKKRASMGPAPSGVLHLLDDREWILTEKVIEATGGDPDFARGVLMEAEGKGWVEKKIAAVDLVYWRLKDYRCPARDSFMVRCGSASPMQALEDLRSVAGCCHKSYIVLDYEVDTAFMDLCFQDGIGLMLYVPRNGYFREILPPEERETTNKRSHLALCEKILFENYVLRLQQGGI